ncbi:hypothetical protein C7974DRAFT_392114 [Boeremia exigua]|uniref:uncharacterized protein n=1 Tax=Boeremia exigua TaxID=749465 RepID=UPI001E8E6F1C|nr:uncharacterized protein C7974DRAFT_392114 [Boeremia exigua]KAH6633087.1 hypothetical protein C7974DRAFT_392114 [Boeremia exigua]
MHLRSTDAITWGDVRNGVVWVVFVLAVSGTRHGDHPLVLGPCPCPWAAGRQVRICRYERRVRRMGAGVLGWERGEWRVSAR